MCQPRRVGPSRRTWGDTSLLSLTKIGATPIFIKEKSGVSHYPPLGTDFALEVFHSWWLAWCHRREPTARTQTHRQTRRLKLDIFTRDETNQNQIIGITNLREALRRVVFLDRGPDRLPLPKKYHPTKKLRGKNGTSLRHSTMSELRRRDQHRKSHLLVALRGLPGTILL